VTGGRSQIRSFVARMACLVLHAFVLATTLPSQADAANHALLVGVTKYDNPKIRTLEGPRNDVIAMRKALEARGFATENMRILADDMEGAATPTRANIVKGLQELATKAQKGDFLVFHYSGHGTTQPETEPGDEPEPGGRDQVLLPKDSGNYDPVQRSITNAIVDNELGRLLERIRATGATIWVIIDACHAGTVTRANVATRSVVPDALNVPAAVPPTLSPAAPQRAGTLRGAQTKGSLIGFFAVDSWTEAIERDFALPNAPGGPQKYGVFTWHLLRALNAGRAGTYRDLARLVALDMAAGSNALQAPLPVFDGNLDAGLFGAKDTGPTRFSVQRDGNDLTLSVGALHDLDEGAEIALFDGPDAKAKRLGLAKITEASSGTSKATSAANLPASAPLWAQLEKPAARFRLSLTLPEKADDALRAAVAQAIGADADKPALPIDIGTANADIRIEQQGDTLNLYTRQTGERSAITIDWKTPDVKALRTHLYRQVRTANLLRLASLADTSASNDNAVDFDVQVIRETDQARLSQSTCTKPEAKAATKLDSGIAQAAGHCDVLQIKLFNRGERDLDVGIFFVEPTGGISMPVAEWRNNGCITSLAAKAQNPIAFSTTLLTQRDGKLLRTGLHRVLVFAFPRQGGIPPSLCHLLQPDAETARADITALRSGKSSTGFLNLMDRAALADPTLRSSNPFASDAQDSDGVIVRQFTLDLLPPQALRGAN